MVKLIFTIDSRVSAGSGRARQTQTLKNLDTQINKAVEAVKLTIMAKFGKDEGKTYFSEFGITKQNRSFKIPTDRNKRLSALPLLAKAVKTHSLTVADFDAAFFETIHTNYNDAFQATQATDSTVAVSVGNKTEQLKQIKAVVRAICTLVKVNYPSTYDGELRSWGFQKEKY